MTTYFTVTNLYWIFIVLGLGMVAWGLIQRFRGSTPDGGKTPDDIDEDHAEGMLAISSGLVILLGVAAYWYFTTR